MRLRILVAAVLAVGTTGAVSADERVTLRPAGSVPGAKLGYIEYLPPGYGRGAKRPLLIFLHGFGEAGYGSVQQLRRVWKLGIPRLIRTKHWPGARPFVVLMPQYSVPAAQECRLADELAAFVRFASRRYAVDVHRIYLTGISCGAIGVWDYLAAHAGEVVAGAVPISGHAVDAFTAARCRLTRVPIWAFHGASDDVVPKQYIAQPIAKLKRCKNPAPVDLRLTIYPRAAHDAWTPTYRRADVFAWLLQHRRA